MSDEDLTPNEMLAGLILLTPDPKPEAQSSSAQAPGSAFPAPECCEECGVNTEELLKERDRLRTALGRIRDYPVHSEPVGGAYAMQDIAHEALSPNAKLSDSRE